MTETEMQEELGNSSCALEAAGDGRFLVICSWEPGKSYGPFPMPMACAFSEASLRGRWRHLGHAC